MVLRVLDPVLHILAELLPQDLGRERHVTMRGAKRSARSQLPALEVLEKVLGVMTRENNMLDIPQTEPLGLQAVSNRFQGEMRDVLDANETLLLRRNHQLSVLA